MSAMQQILDSLAPKPIPVQLIPRFAVLYGVDVTAMQAYCAVIKPGDSLPRGMERRLERLRVSVLYKVRELNTPKRVDRRVGGVT